MLQQRVIYHFKTVKLVFVLNMYSGLLISTYHHVVLTWDEITDTCGISLPSHIFVHSFGIPREKKIVKCSKDGILLQIRKRILTSISRLLLCHTEMNR